MTPPPGFSVVHPALLSLVPVCMTGISLATGLTINDTLSYSSDTLTDWKSSSEKQTSYTLYMAAMFVLTPTCIRTVCAPVPALSLLTLAAVRAAKVAETHLGVTFQIR